jgi:hypothetical protein
MASTREFGLKNRIFGGFFPGKRCQKPFLDCGGQGCCIISDEDLLRCIEFFDMNRFLSQFEKVALIKSDFMETGEQFLKDNPHLLIALLYLDFDLYEPTKKALELFLPRMPKGSILAFDEINNPMWPGETQAFLESLNIRECRVEKLSYEPNMAYIVM